MEMSTADIVPTSSFLEKYKLSIIFFLLGVILIGLGVLGYKVFNFSSSPKVEILGETAENTTTIIIMKMEIAGEVIKPGVYDLKEGSRINDLLIAAGGLSVNADRNWVAKNINLAAKLIDGAKIYIPKLDSQTKSPEEVKVNREGSSQEKIEESKININTASENILDTLWGIGPVTAKNIISGRPYQKIEELLEKKIVKSNVWEKIKEIIVVY